MGKFLRDASFKTNDLRWFDICHQSWNSSEINVCMCSISRPMRKFASKYAVKMKCPQMIGSKRTPKEKITNNIKEEKNTTLSQIRCLWAHWDYKIHIHNDPICTWIACDLKIMLPIWVKTMLWIKYVKQSMTSQLWTTANFAHFLTFISEAPSEITVYILSFCLRSPV